MKGIFLAFALIVVVTGCNAQSKGSIGLFGYKQPVYPGTIQRGITDEGVDVEMTPKVRYNYFIFASSKKEIEPVEIWINGKVFNAGFESIEAPVTTKTFMKDLPVTEDVTLLPQTHGKGWNINIQSEKNSGTETGKKMAGRNELVLIYKQGSKTYYRVVEKLKELEAIPMY